MHRINYWRQLLRRRGGALAISLAVGLTLSGCAPDNAASLIASAQQQQGRGQLRAAVISLKSALQQSDNFQARRLLGEVYLDQGEAVAAETQLRRALTLAPAPDAEKTRVLLGRALLLQGQYARALDESAGGSPDSLTLRGDVLVALGERAEATRAYEAARAKGPRAADALLGLARIAVLEKRSADADALLKDALSMAPGHIASLRFRGDRLRASGKIGEALASYQQILALRPDDPQAHTDLAGIHGDSGRFDQARAAIAQARKAGGATLAVQYATAMLAYQEGQPAEALAAVQQILRVIPEHPAALLLAATVEVQLGADAQAEQHLKTFLSTHPQDLYAGKRMAFLHLRAGRADAALALVTPLAAHHPHDIELLTLAGEAHLHARRYNEAATLFERASAMVPQVADLHAELALSRIGNGDHARAIADLERARQLDGASERNGVLLAMAHMRAHAPDKALAVANDMQARADNPLVQNLKGGIYLASKQAALARQSFQRALTLDPLYLPALANLAQLDKAESKTADAVRRYELALARSPNNVDVLEALAGLAGGRGRHQEAVAWLERAVAVKPDQPGPTLLLADAYVRAGHSPKALLLMRQLAATHPENGDVLGALGNLQWHSADLDGAATTYARLASLNPRLPLPHLRLGAIGLARGELGAARTSTQKALTLAPNAFDAQLTLLNILVARKNFRDALALAADVQQRQPRSPNGFKLEADTHTIVGKHALALPGYERAFVLAPTGAALVQLHGTLVRLGQAGVAEQRMQAWLREHPADIAVRMYYASARMMAGDLPAAIVQLDAVLAISPDNVLALNDIAWACQRLRKGQAQGYAERAHRLAPGNPSVLDTLGWIYWENGQHARALPLLKKAAALAPQSTDIGVHLATALAGSGDKAGARRTLQALLSQPGNAGRHAEAHALLAKL